MGEVWRAEDMRLGREVAIKMLPAEFVADADGMGRLEREAKVLGSLNHSNIAVLYGLEHLVLPPPEGAAASPREAVVPVLIMELVEGEGLDERIARGQVPFDEAISVALQIAAGLQAAHENDIVHRDLKPANIKVRSDGTVKILDFGLATTWKALASDDSQSLAPTQSIRQTSPGVVLGTAAYMSPEQARGRAVDRRTDIWAFGCLLFEMLGGVKAFGGDSLSDVIAAVLKDDPPWDALPPRLEPVCLHVLRRCLAKDPARRFHDIADVRIELEEALASSRARGRKRGSGSWRPTARGLATVGGAAILTAAAVVVALWPAKVELPTFRALTFRSGHTSTARFSPDGDTVIFGFSTRDHPLWLMSTRTTSVESSPLDLPPADILGISRTGRMAILLARHNEGSWITVGTLATVDIAGGAPRPILERVNDGDIARDGEDLAIVHEVNHLQRLEYPIGTVLFETRGWISHVRIAPDGNRVAFLHHPHYGDDRGLVALVDRTGNLTELTPELPDSLQGLAWDPSGTALWYSAYVFGQGGVLWSVRPGAAPTERLRSPVALRIQDIARNGQALFVAGDSRAEISGRLAGAARQTRFEGWNDDSIGGLAADGSTFAGNIQVSTENGEYAVFVRGADGLPPVRLGFGNVFGMSPDGRWVFTHRMSGDPTRITMLPTGPGERRVIDLGDVVPLSSGNAMLTCSLDGRLAAFTGFIGGVGPQAFVLDLVASTVRPVGPVGVRGAVISPDGSRIAAISPQESIVVYTVAGGGGTDVQGAAPGEVPLQWSRDGRAILVWNRAFPARIQRIRLADGHRELALQIMPEDPAGVLYGQILLSPGGEHYVYRYRRDLSGLFLTSPIL